MTPNPTPNQDPSKGDYSLLAAFSKAYQLAAKQAQDAAGDWNKNTWRRKAMEAGWMCVYRHARHAGLTDAEAEKITHDILMTAMKGLVNGPEVMAIEAFKEKLLHLARRRIAAMEHQEQNQGPYYVSVAWREKHDAA